MYKFFLLLGSVFALVTNILSQANNEKTILLSLSVVKKPNGAVTSKNKDYDPDLKLVILNNTDTASSFYKMGNLWSEDAIRLELSLKDSIFSLYYYSFCDSRNFPDAQTLRPGDSAVYYLKIEECYHHGPCPCVASMPKNYRFPTSNLRGAKLRAFYKINMENHQSAVAIGIDNAKFLDSIARKKGKLLKSEEKYQRSFVTTELVSKAIELNIDTW